MKSLFTALGGFFRETLSEQGVGSYSRVAAFIIVIATVLWITFLVIIHKQMPDLTGPTVFMTSGAGSQYGLNQLKNWKAGNTNGGSTDAKPAA